MMREGGLGVAGSVRRRAGMIGRGVIGRGVAVVFGLAFLGAPALAGTSGLYGAADLAYHWPQAHALVDDGSLESGAESSVAGFGRLGYRIDDTFRVEIEGGYRPGSWDQVFNTYGRDDHDTLMLNGLVDLFGARARLRPFAGLGIGLDHAHTHAHQMGVDTGTDLYSSQTAFAFQALAGVSYAATPRINLDLTFRNENSRSRPGEIVNCVFLGPARCNQSGTSVAGFHDNSLSIGLRYAFGRR